MRKAYRLRVAVSGEMQLPTGPARFDFEAGEIHPKNATETAVLELLVCAGLATPVEASKKPPVKEPTHDSEQED